MNKNLVFLLAASVLSTAVVAQDPVMTDGDKYKVILENDKIRILDYQDKPGEKTQSHHHPDFVLYALGPFKRKLVFPDGKEITRDFKKGDVIWMYDQTHIGENTGKTDTHALIVELKPSINPAPDTAKIAEDKKRP